MAMTTISKLPILVREVFKAAQENGHLTFYQTQVSIVQCNGLPFQVRFSPTLANKPKSDRAREPKEKPVDPFSDPPDGLFITDLPCHNLVLNKFPIIPDHFILATKEFKEQTDLLDEGDLGAAFECINAYRENGEELFGFFNSGQYSGASQPHRHIQFLPVASMRSGIEKGQSWDVMADILANSSKPYLPFYYLSHAIHEKPSPRALYEIYIELHNKACRKVQGSRATSSISPKSSISYNLGLTDGVMVLCPRSSEGMSIKNSDGEQIGLVSVNGTVLGGTLLVKSEAEFSTLRNDKSTLVKILSAIGFPPTTFEQDRKL